MLCLPFQLPFLQGSGELADSLTLTPHNKRLDFLLFGMQCAALEPAQAHSPKLISHVSGSLTLYSNKLSSFELHLLIYSASELHCVCGYALVV
jgi:hypothetical protein